MSGPPQPATSRNRSSAAPERQIDGASVATSGGEVNPPVRARSRFRPTILAVRGVCCFEQISGADLVNTPVFAPMKCQTCGRIVRKHDVVCLGCGSTPKLTASNLMPSPNIAPSVTCPFCQSADVNLRPETPAGAILSCNQCRTWFVIKTEPPLETERGLARPSPPWHAAL